MKRRKEKMEKWLEKIRRKGQIKKNDLKRYNVPTGKKQVTKLFSTLKY
jgi:hypothetical protein